MILGLRAFPKDDSGFSPAEVVFGSTLSLTGEFLEHSEIPPEIFLRQVEQAVWGFSGPPRHHVVLHTKSFNGRRICFCHL